MTRNMAACRWTAPAICWGNGGQAGTAGTFRRRCCPSTRRGRPPSSPGAHDRILRSARSAAEPWPRTGGKRTARQPVQKEPTASSSGNICEKNGAHLLTIRPRKAHIYQGFFGPDSGRVIYFYARLVLVPILSTFTHRPAAPVYTVSA